MSSKTIEIPQEEMRKYEVLEREAEAACKDAAIHYAVLVGPNDQDPERDFEQFRDAVVRIKRCRRETEALLVQWSKTFCFERRWLYGIDPKNSTVNVNLGPY